MKLARIDVNGPDVFTNPCDLRKDLHVFVDYVANRDVKRSTRGNNLPKVDARRLAKLITDPDAVEQVEANAQGTWLGYIDWLALKLGFVGQSESPNGFWGRFGPIIVLEPEVKSRRSLAVGTLRFSMVSGICQGCETKWSTRRAWP